VPLCASKRQIVDKKTPRMVPSIVTLYLHRSLTRLRSLWSDWHTYHRLDSRARYRVWTSAATNVDAEFRRRVTGRTLLDLGCGPPIARQAARDVAASVYIGVDALTRLMPSVTASLDRLPIADGAVDGINCLSVLEHVFEPTAVVGEMRRVLTPGGCVRLQVPFMLQYHGYPDDYWRFTHTALKRLFEDAGFRVVALETEWTKGTYLNAAKMLEDGSFDFPRRWQRFTTRLMALVLYRASHRLDRFYAEGAPGQYQSLALLAELPAIAADTRTAAPCVPG
jgi:SAM-dependent methyltransferase